MPYAALSAGQRECVESHVRAGDLAMSDLAAHSSGMSDELPSNLQASPHPPPTENSRQRSA